MNCPVCNVVLVAHERQGVEIDMCPKCRGVWLDRGELDKLIERAEHQPPPRYEGDDDDEDRYERSRHRRGEEHPRQRRSWWSELFD